MLTIVMAYSVATALREQTGLDFRIKWYQRHCAEREKVVGILTEMSTEIEYINHVVIGVGINVNTGFSGGNLCDGDFDPTGIRKRHGDARELIAAILRQFEVQYERFVKEGGSRLSAGKHTMRFLCELQPGSTDPGERRVIGRWRSGSTIRESFWSEKKTDCDVRV